MAWALPEFKILKVTPGKLSKYLNNEDLETASGYTPGKSFASGMSSLGRMIPGEFTLNMKYLKLSKACMNSIRRKLQGEIYIKIKWSFLDIEEFIISPETLTGQKLKFDYTVQYPLEIDDELINRFEEHPIAFELLAESQEGGIVLSKEYFVIKDLLEPINNKVTSRIEFISSHIDPKREKVAVLEIWYKITCNKKNIKSMFAKDFPNKIMLEPLCDDARKDKNIGPLRVTDSEIDHFADGLQLVLNRNKALKTTQSEMDIELDERVRWLHLEANWKQTLQEHAILHGKNPDDVQWRQWREKDTAKVKLRRYDNKKPMTYDPKFIITIESLIFLEETSPLKNDAVKQLFVEYSFLGQEGPEMETPFSLPKKAHHEDVIFHFQKVFGIDLEEDYNNCKMLTEFIRTDGIIRFVVVSEPLANIEKPIQTCEEIGVAEVSINELIQLETNEDTYEYEIMDINMPNVLIGYLTIKFEGIMAARKMALLFMAPEGYRLVM